MFAQKMGQEHVDIITFYNDVFVPSVKPLLVKVGPDGIIRRNNKLTEEGNNSDGMSCCYSEHRVVSCINLFCRILF